MARSQAPQWLRLMIRMRLFEETLADLFGQGRLAGVVHLSIGQALAVGATLGFIEPA